ncbi:MAG: InlB B-repeat-containing protein [Blautia massiliensis (ex Durand et al. 2017)]
MVANLLTDGSAAVRCKTTNGDQVSYGSEYQVTVDFDAVPQFAPAPQTDPASTAQPAPQDTPETAEEADEETEQTEQTERTEENTAALQQAEEALQAAEEALQAAESAATSESAMTDEQLAALEEARANYDAAKAAYDEAMAAASAAGRLAAPAAPQNDGDEPEVKPTYTITIKYVFTDGDEAATPVPVQLLEGATKIPEGESSVYTSPEVQGYAPKEEQKQIDLNEYLKKNFPEGINSDAEIIVTYYPAEVEYTVKYYLQNINNDEYTLDTTITKTGFTEDPVDKNLATEKEGFYALPYDTTLTIAADNSTTVQIYYDRYYYLMTFDLDEGGYGVEPIYARYGAPIEVGEPERPGYTFTGWKLKNGSDELVEPPETMPAENQSYVAQWKADDTAKVTLVFWGENADNTQYSYLSSHEIYEKPDTEYTYDLAKPTCGLEEHIHSEDKCGLNCSHQHNVNCYSAGGYTLSETDQPDEKLTNHDNGIYSYDTTEETWWGSNTETHWYLKIGDTWYSAYISLPFVGSYKHDTQKIEYNCQHQHTDACYACGMKEHIHTEQCYPKVEGIDTRLWHFVRSDTVTVAADGSSIVNVYFKRAKFTLHFRKAGSNQDNYGVITKKWGAKIGEEFKAKSNAAGSAMWSTDRWGASPWTSYLDIMPSENRTYYNRDDSGNVQIAYYYGEKLTGRGYDLLYESTARGNGLTITEEDEFDITGFTFDDFEADYAGDGDFYYNGAKFYYTRNRYDLKFFSNGKELTNKQETLKYQESFADYYFEPDYPENLGPGYEFEGWYNAPYFNDNSHVNFDTATMPANDVMLYAHWVPVNRTVTFYLDSESMNEPVGGPLTIPHGEKIDANDVPTEEALKAANGGQYEEYDFVGWFYMDDGVEKAFDPDNMQVNRDLDLYAKWSSKVPVEYTIHYVYEDEEGRKVKIADDFKGSALGGTTVTVDAKFGNDLYAAYQQGFFPKVSSHTLRMELGKTNEYTFYYIQKDKVWYTVQFLEEGTEKPLHAPRKNESSYAVVTESFEPIAGYMPDALQKQLVLAASTNKDPDAAKEDELKNNVITFYYHKDNVHAPVTIEYWFQNIKDDKYTRDDDRTETYIDKEIDKPVVVEPEEVTGFTFKRATDQFDNNVPIEDGKVSVELTDKGLTLKLYYNRNEYPYKFQYLEQGTDNQLADPETDEERFGAQVSEDAKDIPGYTLVDGEQKSKGKRQTWDRVDRYERIVVERIEAFHHY